MGTARWDPADWSAYAASTKHKSTAAVFAARAIDPALNPFGVTLRESRDSAINPESNAIIVGLDVTGSMGMIADALARNGLGTMVEEILARKPVADPHIMCLGIGDILYDEAPLQVTQFEADIRIARQLEKIWLEKGGGGNCCESYTLPWYFAALHTSIDCFEKRGRKGYLFTVGDEEPPRDLPGAGIARVLGDSPQRDFDSHELLTLVSRMYHVFHVIVEEGSHARHDPRGVRDRWTDLLGQRVIGLSDHTKLAEVIVSAIEVNEGRDRDAVAKSWAKDTAKVVRRAVGALTPAAPSHSAGVVRF
ncbi:MAG: VWA domain-containing protein [Synechococcaceae cyanobacterium SM1_2_3]|nr:VWA domain-containing protein [Synechococcaceae cyanobacterium SM1_2_3]